MAISWVSDLSEGPWLSGSGVPWWQLVTFGPGGYEAYARLRFIPDPVRTGQREADQDLPSTHPSDLDQSRAALRVLAGCTGTPQDCWFAVWDGYPGSIDVPAGLPLLELPHRSYGLLRGDLADLDGWAEAVGSDFGVGPAFVWPSDHRWCFASDVDPHWAGIGGEEAAVSALLLSPDLDVVRADPQERQPTYA